MGTSAQTDLVRVSPYLAASIAVALLYAAMAAVVLKSEDASLVQLREELAATCSQATPSWPGRWLCAATGVLEAESGRSA